MSERKSQLVLGLDPDPMDLWPSEHEPEGNMPAQRAADAVLEHCFALIEAVAPSCVAIKPQLARFEALGSAGWKALNTTIAFAHDLDLLVIADAKRGDIDVSARAYAHALTRGIETPWGPSDGLRADATTVNPLMGSDAVGPFVSVARESGRRRLDACAHLQPGCRRHRGLGAGWGRACVGADRGARRPARSRRGGGERSQRCRGRRRSERARALGARPRTDAARRLPAAGRGRAKGAVSRTWPPPSHPVARAV